jgi:hypothetical protein
MGRCENAEFAGSLPSEETNRRSFVGPSHTARTIVFDGKAAAAFTMTEPIGLFGVKPPTRRFGERIDRCKSVLSR